jgi:AcrR family transcriptional regulator
VPKTRTTLSKEEKIDRIVIAAERRLAAGGFDALSVSAIAGELGLAQNAIYWYFPSKDHLFVAALERMLRDIAARKPSRSRDAVERILWFTDQFAELSRLRGSMNERASQSEPVAQFVGDLDRMLERMLSNALADKVLAEDLPLAVASFRATVEGTFVKGLGKRERRRLLRFALEQLTR